MYKTFKKRKTGARRLKWHLPALLAAGTMLQVCCQQVLVMAEQCESNDCSKQGLASTRVMSAAEALYGHLEQPWNASRALWRCFLHSGSSWVATQWNPVMATCSAGPESPSSSAIGRLWSGKDGQSGCSLPQIIAPVQKRPAGLQWLPTNGW